jgi:hypothetical protein
MRVVLGVRVRKKVIVTVDYTATTVGGFGPVTVRRVLIPFTLVVHTIQSTIYVALVSLLVNTILQLISSTQILKVVVAINWIVEHFKNVNLALLLA